jgi:hypothetical protein
LIRLCRAADIEEVCGVINDSARAYEGRIPEDRFHQPCMPKEGLLAEMADGVAFYGYEEQGRLLALLGQFDAGSKRERVYDHLSFDMRYHTTSDDWLAPSMQQVGSRLVAGTATLSVQASDASSVEAVVVAYAQRTGTWDSTRLVEHGGI